MSRAWAETLLGESVDAEEFPSLENRAVANAPVKPKIALKNVFKEAVSEQKVDEVNGGNRLNDIIIHKVPENTNRHKQHTQTMKTNLLENCCSKFTWTSHLSGLWGLGDIINPKQEN